MTETLTHFQLLLSVPAGIRNEIEAPAIDAIRKASHMLTKHAAPPNSGCDLQAKFFQNVLRVFRRAQNPRPTSTKSRQPVQAQTHEDAEVTATHHVANGSTVAPSGLPDLSSYVVPDPTADLDKTMADCDYSMGLQDFAFADNDLWSNFFAGAGFDINDGVFLPNDIDQIGSLGPPT